MESAGRHLYHPAFSVNGVDFTGRLDSEVWRELVLSYSVPDTSANLNAFISAYAGEMENPSWEAKQCPGVSDMLRLLAENPRITKGILTGNFRTTGLMKLERAGIDSEQFTVCAWGEEARTRAGLVPVALNRWRSHTGAPDPKKVVIVGDSPRDVECARAAGSPCVAVATGLSSVSELEKAGAHLVIENFTDPVPLVRFIEALL